jgi:hypothetical protein
VQALTRGRRAYAGRGVAGGSTGQKSCSGAEAAVSVGVVLRAVGRPA